MNNINEHELYQADKKECYKLVHASLRALFDGDNHLIPNLSNTSAVLNQALDNINWVGFYLMKDGELLLGPFQGKIACVHITVGRGVCGTAVLKDETILVPDVHQFPGHIACDSASRSEIVIPIHHNGIVVGVLDIDSPILSRFDDVDKEGLEEVVNILENNCNWN